MMISNCFISCIRKSKSPFGLLDWDSKNSLQPKELIFLSQLSYIMKASCWAPRKFWAHLKLLITFWKCKMISTIFLNSVSRGTNRSPYKKLLDLKLSLTLKLVHILLQSCYQLILITFYVKMVLKLLQINLRLT